MQGWGKREYLEKTRRQAAPSSTIPACENLGVNPPGIEPGSQRSRHGHPTSITAGNRLGNKAAIHSSECSPLEPRLLLEFRMCESSWTIPLVDGFSRRSPVYPSPSFRRYFILASLHPHWLSSLDVESRPNISTTNSYALVHATVLKQAAIQRDASLPPPRRRRYRDEPGLFRETAGIGESAGRMAKAGSPLMKTSPLITSPGAGERHLYVIGVREGDWGGWSWGQEARANHLDLGLRLRGLGVWEIKKTGSPVCRLSAPLCLQRGIRKYNSPGPDLLLSPGPLSPRLFCCRYLGRVERAVAPSERPGNSGGAERVLGGSQHRGIKRKRGRTGMREEIGNLRENPPTSSIARHDSHVRGSESDPAGNRTRSTCSFDIFLLVCSNHPRVRWPKSRLLERVKKGNERGATAAPRAVPSYQFLTDPLCSWARTFFASIRGPISSPATAISAIKTFLGVQNPLNPFRACLRHLAGRRWEQPYPPRQHPGDRQGNNPLPSPLDTPRTCHSNSLPHPPPPNIGLLMDHLQTTNPFQPYPGDGLIRASFAIKTWLPSHPQLRCHPLPSARGTNLLAGSTQPSPLSRTEDESEGGSCGDIASATLLPQRSLKVQDASPSSGATRLGLSPHHNPSQTFNKWRLRDFSLPQPVVFRVASSRVRVSVKLTWHQSARIVHIGPACSDAPPMPKPDSISVGCNLSPYTTSPEHIFD
ncbi:hypothetical protein PR048_014334 [Dryococelus australis]|uniref:Uncharacterized protein n=1 Tax=Dryococelus australis TaxID=614101 RepID=A0ABQ9HDY7_9NEOP|nr:hypothetical protein PR048_014334 [Dryococelus australis]